MRTDGLAILGAGGHAKVVLDAVLHAWQPDALEVYDDDLRKSGTSLLDVLVRSPIAWSSLPPLVHVAIGDNRLRAAFGARVGAANRRLITVTHPAATVSSRADLSEGCFVAARAVVAPAAILGAGTIANHACVIDHDCRVGEWCHVAPGAVLGGGVQLGRGCLIGSGAIVLPGRTIGDGATVGAGAVVTHDLEARVVVCGVPARVHGNGS